MKQVAYIILIFLPILIFPQNKWELTHYIYDQHPVSIEVVDSNYINIFFSVGNNDKLIYNSQDQGKKWKLMYATNVYNDNVNMQCIDSNNIFLGFKGRFIFYISNGFKKIDSINIDLLKSYYDFSMKDSNVGIITNAYIVPDTFFLLVTKDRWKTYRKFHKQDDSTRLSYNYPQFKNDSIVNLIVGNSRGRKGSFFCEFNINSFDYKLNWIDKDFGTYDMCIIDNKYIFTCGESDVLNGGSSNDGIFKSSDGGKTWRRVLDLYTDQTKFIGHDFPPFGLQSISFKDSLTGIAVGQSGKIVYTYDGGESWIYETKLHDSIYQPPTMKVRYAGSVPIIADFDGEIYRMIEDNLAPKSEDTLTISGRVWEGKKGQPGIPVIIGSRVTMTDSNGNYKFTRLAKGTYIVRAVNKYFDAGNPKYDYKPFKYIPERYEFELSRDTSGIDFNAIDLRTFYTVSGEIITSTGEGLKNIPITIGDSTTKSTEDGKFLFPKIEQKRTYELIPYSTEYKFTPWAYSINIDKNLDTFRFVASPITGVTEENPSKQMQITPNPAGDYIEISGLFNRRLNPTVDDHLQIEIYDILGILVAQTSLSVYNSQTGTSDLLRMNISHLSPGMYFLKFGNQFAKFVKVE